MKVWIDLANSPHPLLFAPIADHIQERGDTVAVTVRDQAQTLELATNSWQRFDVVGGASPSGRARKGQALAGRIRCLTRWALRNKPDIALSHNSYAQIVAARMTRVPAVTAMDYEFQPANHLGFRLAERILLPEALPRAAVRAQGARAAKVRYYAGLKEEMYLGEFEPDPDVLSAFNLTLAAGDSLVVARTPPSGALYHGYENELFTRALVRLAAQTDVALVVLARYREQRDSIARLELERCLVPEAALDSRSLVRRADLFLGAGGTMTREAALAGVPTISVFSGRVPSVDSWLERRGAMTRVDDVAQIPIVKPRKNPPASINRIRDRGRELVREFVAGALDT